MTSKRYLGQVSSRVLDATNGSTQCYHVFITCIRW